MSFEELRKRAKRVTRVKAEDPEAVRERDRAHIEKYVGEDWAKGNPQPTRGRVEPE